MTEAEKTLWQRMRHDQLGFRVRRQHVIGQYIVDFYMPALKIIIEVDGGQHNENVADKKRDEYLEKAGYSVLRYLNNNVLNNTEGVLEDMLCKIEMKKNDAL